MAVGWLGSLLITPGTSALNTSRCRSTTNHLRVNKYLYYVYTPRTSHAPEVRPPAFCFLLVKTCSKEHWPHLLSHSIVAMLFFLFVYYFLVVVVICFCCSCYYVHMLQVIVVFVFAGNVADVDIDVAAVVDITGCRTGSFLPLLLLLLLSLT